jgi:hypothetical protein
VRGRLDCDERERIKKALLGYRRRPHSKCVGWLSALGAHPIQPFEGSRPWGGRLCIFNGVGFMGDASGTGIGVGKRQSRVGWVVVFLW